MQVIPSQEIVPFKFTKRFFPEIHHQFTLYLPRNDLLSYSLASRALNREANRILWHSILVKPRVGGEITAFAHALKRDPTRAANVRHLSFIPKDYCFQYSNGAAVKFSRTTIFADTLTEEFWEYLAEALRLVILPRTIWLLVDEQLDSVGWTEPEDYPDAFVDVVANVFGVSPVANLRTHIPFYSLFRLHQAWPDLITLRVESAGSGELLDIFDDLPPDALQRLRYVELDFDLICRIVPGRPIETICQTGEPCSLEDDAPCLATTMRHCHTLCTAQVYCNCTSTKDAANFLAGFGHDTLRNFSLIINIQCEPRGRWFYENSTLLHPTPQLFMDFLPSGALAQYPKLEHLQIVVQSSGPPFRVDMRAIRRDLAALLNSEAHPMLNWFEFFFEMAPSFRSLMHTGSRFEGWSATRYDDGWVVEAVDYSSRRPRFEACTRWT